MLNDRMKNGNPSDRVYHAVLPDYSKPIVKDSVVERFWHPAWQEKTVCGRADVAASVLVYEGKNKNVVGCKSCLKRLA